MPKHGLGPDVALVKLPDLRVSDKNAKKFVFDLYLADLARVYKEKKEDQRLIGEHTPKEMFHTAVGLLSVSLVSMDKTTIYEALFEKSSVTLFFLSRDDDCTDHIMESNARAPETKKKEKKKSEEKVKMMNQLREALHAVSLRNEDEEDAYESGTEETSEFGLVFASDVSSEEEEEEDEGGGAADEDSSEIVDGNASALGEENDSENSGDADVEETDDSSISEVTEEENEDLAHKSSQGYHSFLASCLQRKIMVKEMFSGYQTVTKKDALLPVLGPEHRIAAVCNFRVRKVDTKKRVIHITFLSVRKHLRRLGIGSRIIEIVKAPQMSGIYDAVVVHADLNATEFFIRNGFSGDPLLNKQWASFAGEYVNCLLMTYFPPLSFGNTTTSGSKLLKSIDKSIDDWLVETGNVHQMQYTLCKRLRAEVVRLQNQLLSQDSLIQVLKRQVLKQAHAIDSLRSQVAFDADGTRRSDNLHSIDAISFEMLPNLMDNETCLSMGFNGLIFSEGAGDADE